MILCIASDVGNTNLFYSKAFNLDIRIFGGGHKLVRHEYVLHEDS